MFFPVNIAKLLITAIFIEHLRWLLLINFFFVNPFQVNALLLYPLNIQKTDVFRGYRKETIHLK